MKVIRMVHGNKMYKPFKYCLFIAVVALFYTATMPMESIKNYFYRLFSTSKVAESKSAAPQIEVQREKTQQPKAEAKPAVNAGWRSILYSYFYGKPSIKVQASVSTAKSTTVAAPEKSQFADQLKQSTASLVVVKETPAELFSYRTFDTENDVQFSQKWCSEAFDNIRMHSGEALAEAYQVLGLETTASLREVQENYEFLVKDLQDKELGLAEEKGKISLYATLLEKEGNKSELQNMKSEIQKLEERAKSIADQRKTIEDAFSLIKYHSPEALQESYKILHVAADVSLSDLSKRYTQMTGPYRAARFMGKAKEFFGPFPNKLKKEKQKQAEAIELEGVQEINEQTINEAYEIIKFQSPGILQECYKILELEPTASPDQIDKQKKQLVEYYIKQKNDRTMLGVLLMAYDVIKMRSKEALKDSYKTLGLEPNASFMDVRAQYAEIMEFLNQKLNAIKQKNAERDALGRLL